MQSWNPYLSQAESESYGLQFTSTTLVAQGHSSKYLVPTSASVDATWRATGIGCGLIVPGMTVRQVFKNGTIGGLADTDALLAATVGLSETTLIAQTVNYLGHGAADHTGTVFLTAGSHTIDAVFFEMTGGDEVEVYHAPGIISTWSATMKLVGSQSSPHRRGHRWNRHRDQRARRNGEQPYVGLRALVV